MSEHTTLYRKWRPNEFASVIGQNHITDVLKYQVENGKTTHAYLFCGSRGTGKTTCAKILSKAINCLSPLNGDPCGICEACKAIESNNCTDIVEMDAASNNGVDYIRDIRDEVIYTPALLKKKVYIIDEVHMLSSGAFNALLKTLEEPPSHVVFILATTELHKLPATITSRCQRFDFKRISSDDIASRLEYIALKENISLTHEAAKLIGRISQGGMRDSISMLELCAGSKGTVDVDKVNNTAGIIGRDKSSLIIKAILKKNISVIFEIIQSIYTSSSDIGLFFTELIEMYRDMLVIKSIKDAKAYLDLTDDEFTQINDLASQYTTEKIIYIIKGLENAYTVMQRSSAVKRVSAELALISLTDDRLSSSNDALLSRIASLEEKLASGSFMCSIQNDNEQKPENNLTKTSSENLVSRPIKDSLKPLTAWSEVINTVERNDSSSAAHLKMSSAYIGSDSIVVKVSNSFVLMLLDNDATKELIATGINLSCDGFSFNKSNIKFEVEKISDCSSDDPLSAL